MRKILSLFLLLLLSSCQEWFPYSPFTAVIPEDQKGRNIKNLMRIRSEVFSAPLFTYNGEDAVGIALISDSHYWYDQTVDVAERINRDTSVSMVFHAGDISESGLPKEFLFTSDQMDRLTLPSFAIIGNHDYLAMGKDYYQEVFGTPEGSCSRGTSYVVTLHSKITTVRIVMFDNSVWEANNSRPDFEWLDRALRKGREQADWTIVVAHVPPWDQQSAQGYGWEYNTILEKYDVPLSLHGHLHHGVDDEDVSEYKDSSVRYAIIGSSRYGYARAFFTVNSAEFELVKL